MDRNKEVHTVSVQADWMSTSQHSAVRARDTPFIQMNLMCLLKQKQNKTTTTTIKHQEKLNTSENVAITFFSLWQPKATTDK